MAWLIPLRLDGKYSLTTSSETIAIPNWKRNVVTSLKSSNNSQRATDSTLNGLLLEAVIYATIFAREAQRQIEGSSNTMLRAGAQLRSVIEQIERKLL